MDTESISIKMDSHILVSERMMKSAARASSLSQMVKSTPALLSRISKMGKVRFLCFISHPK